MKVKEISTNMIYEWDIKKILDEINRDHSDEWIPYDESDWREGWDNWCEGDIYTLIED